MTEVWQSSVSSFLKEDHTIYMSLLSEVAAAVSSIGRLVPLEARL